MADLQAINRRALARAMGGAPVMDICAIYKSEFDRTDNPLFAWIAFRHCRKQGLDFPDWVLRYLSSVAQDFARISRDMPEDRPSKVLHALKFSELGSGDVFSRLTAEGFEIGLAMLVKVHINIGGTSGKRTKLDFAYDEVAKVTGIRRWKVQKSYRKKFPLKK